MGYFGSGTEGGDYRARWCVRCANNGDELDENGCAVWDAHLLFNSAQCRNDDLARTLAVLIPRTEDGGRNQKCRMFRGKA